MPLVHSDLYQLQSTFVAFNTVALPSLLDINPSLSLCASKTVNMLHNLEAVVNTTYANAFAC